MALDPECVKKESASATTLDRPQLKALFALMRERRVATSSSTALTG